jgi:hypothetical protein
VEQFALNETIEDTAFQVTFPVGTWVRDYRTDEKYILREGGARREIEAGEFTGDNYEQLLHSEPPSRALARKRVWGLAVSALLFLAIGGWFLYRHWRRLDHAT